MDEEAVIIVYKPRNRDITFFREACNPIGFTLHVAKTENDFRRILSAGSIFSIVAPLGSDEEGADNAMEFANIAAKYLQPEDADIGIIYSTEERTTPLKWSGEPYPRPIQSYHISPYFIASDERWLKTVDKLKWLRNQFIYQRNTNREAVKIEFSGTTEIPFPSEATFLLRAAFKEMSKITVEFPKQGFRVNRLRYSAI
jgi:hypothetical protein